MNRSRGEGRNLKLKLLVGCLTPLIIGVLCQTLYTVSAQKRALIGGLEVKVRSLGELMVNVVGPSVAVEDVPGVKDALGFLAKDADFAFAEALTPDGKVMAFLGSESARASLGGAISVVPVARVLNAADVMVALYPLKEMGTVVVGLKTTSIRATAQRMVMRAALIAAVSILMAVVVVLLLAGVVVRRNRDLKLIMDTVGQGFMSVKREGDLLAEHSAILEDWFGPWQQGVPFWKYFAGTSQKLANTFELLWGNVREDWLPLDVALDQLPRRADAKGKTFEFEYKPVASGAHVSQFLLVISDVTVLVAQERAAVVQRECMSLFQWLLNDRSALFQFFEDGARLVQGLVGPDTGDIVTLKRDIHTLKGNASIFHLTSVTRVCDEIEERLQEAGEALTDEERARLVEAWSGAEQRLRQLGKNDDGRIEIAAAEYQTMIDAIERRAPYPSLEGMVRGWAHEPMKQRFRRYGEQARALGRRLGRGDIHVQIETDDMRLSGGVLAPFWAAAVHVIRNAVDHGIESPEERSRAGKVGPGTLSLRSSEKGDRFVIEVEDDGRGVSWDLVAERARAAGLAAETREDLIEALCADGFTTRDTATDISGRGVGLAAVRAACHETGGECQISSEAGQGTRLEFSWPLAVLRAEPDACPTPVGVVAAAPTSGRPVTQPL